jgi:hypothetical protein
MSMGPPGLNWILKPAAAPHRLDACPSSCLWNHGRPKSDTQAVHMTLDEETEGVGGEEIGKED